MSPTAEAEPTAASLGRLIPAVLLHESTLNPRKRRDAEKDKELTASIIANGIIEPLIARAHPKRDGEFEIIAGARRYSCGLVAQLQEFPVIVREATDAQLVEWAFTENDQRDGMLPIDDARGMRQWMDLDPTMTPERLAERLGRSTKHVENRLRLLELHKEVLKAFESDAITVSHAERIARRVPIEKQPDALKACFDREFDYETGKHKDVLAPTRQLNHWIGQNVRLKLSDSTTQEEFPEMTADIAKAAAKGATILELSESWAYEAHKDGEPLTANLYRECKKSDKGAQKGVFVVGRRQGQVVWVRLNEPEKPKTVTGTNRSSSSSPAPSAKQKAAEKAQRDKEERDRKIREAVSLACVIDGAKRTKTVGKALLIEIAVMLSSGLNWLEDEVKAISQQVGLPDALMRYRSDRKALAKLTPAKLAQVVAVFMLMNDSLDSDVEGVYAALGVNEKKITKEVAKQIDAAKAEKPAKVDEQREAATKKLDARDKAKKAKAAKKGRK